MGGSDQWGNITAGIDLIRKLRGRQAHGLVWPLLTTASGAKFGKTEAGTIWLDPARTSPFRFYQFWLNTDDRDVVAYLKYFTFLDRATNRGARGGDVARAGKREAQRVLAREVTTLVHGAEQAARAEHASSVLFGEDIATLRGRRCAGGVRRCAVDRMPAGELRAEGHRARGSGRARAAGGVEGRGAAAGQSGGVYVNNRRMSDPQARLTREQAIGGQLFVLRKGQKQNHLVRLT